MKTPSTDWHILLGFDAALGQWVPVVWGTFDVCFEHAVMIGLEHYRIDHAATGAIVAFVP